MKRTFRAALLLSTICATPALAQSPACGGNFAQFLEGVKAEAVAQGVSDEVATRALRGAAIDNKVL